MTQPFSPKAVLFDLDGTLLDTARDLGGALNRVLSEFDLPQLDYQTYRNTASHGALGLLKLGFKESISQHNLEDLRKRFLDHYDQHLYVDTCVFEQAASFLNALNERNIPWGIVTNKPESLTTALLPHFRVFDYSQVMVGGDTLSVAKPHPEPLLYAAKQLNIAPADIWYVGDAQRDIEAGNSANMLSIIARYGYIDSNENVAEWQADLIVDNLDELVHFL